MKNQEYILVVQMPMQPQTLLGYPDEQSAFDAALQGAKSGFILSKAEAGQVIVHTVPGSVYLILSKQAFERQAMQQRLASNGRV